MTPKTPNIYSKRKPTDKQRTEKQTDRADQRQSKQTEQTDRRTNKRQGQTAPTNKQTESDRQNLKGEPPPREWRATATDKI